MIAHVNGLSPHYDEDAIVTITRVEPKTPKGWFHVFDSLKREYMTQNQLVAALAEQYRVKRWSCRPVSVRHWPEREILGLARAEQERAS